MERLSFDEFIQNKNRPLILDGAIGSLLQSDDNSSSLWSSELNITEPDKVIDIHKQYIDAGADIITTNTFRTNPTAYINSNLKIDNKEFVKRSIALALTAREDTTVLIAGSNAPAEDCYQVERTLSKEELTSNHHKHIEYLWGSGVDFILNETFSHFDEIKIVTEFCSNKNIPFIVSLYLTDNLSLLDDTSLTEILEYLNQYKPLAIGINCISQKVFTKINLDIFANINWGFYLNCGSGNVTDKTISCGIFPFDYVETAKKYLNYKPSFIGSCCGSNPAHTKALKEMIDEIY